MEWHKKDAPADTEQSPELGTHQSPSASAPSRNRRETKHRPAQGTGRSEVPDKEGARMRAGDPDVSRQGVETGEETPGGSSPTPDQNRVDEIGEAVGVTYQDNEPLTFGERYAQRDNERWEDDPASSEDYKERQAALESDLSSTKKPVRGRSPEGRGFR